MIKVYDEKTNSVIHKDPQDLYDIMQVEFADCLYDVYDTNSFVMQAATVLSWIPVVCTIKIYRSLEPGTCYTVFVFPNHEKIQIRTGIEKELYARLFSK